MPCRVQGVIDTGTRRRLSIISFNLLLPANNLYNIAKNISPSTLVDFLPFAANTVVRRATRSLPTTAATGRAGSLHTLHGLGVAVPTAS
jgi:hypothetical protein